jgi:DNA-binding transcriptional LysR family regulator
MQTNLDIDLLRAFVTVADTGSFSRAGERLLRGQSTISLQIKRLEDSVGRRLLDRSSRHVLVTPEGEHMLAYARRMVALNDEMLARVNELDIEGLVRLGTPEDFATTHLSDVLARFAQIYPGVTLEVTCDLTLNLLDGFRAEKFDLVLVKREPTRASSGVRVWREPLVWVGGSRDIAVRGAVPLIVSPPPCVYRKRATDSLDQHGRPWRIAYACASLAGSVAAVRAGLGITVLPKEMVPAGLRILDSDELPDLPDSEIALISAPAVSEPALRLREHIVRSLEKPRAPA